MKTMKIACGLAAAVLAGFPPSLRAQTPDEVPPAPVTAATVEEMSPPPPASPAPALENTPSAPARRTQQQPRRVPPKSSRGSSRLPSAPGAPTSLKDPSGLMKRDNRGLVNLDFVDVEISDIAKSISELTKKNFLLDDKIRGKITIISPRPVSVEEAYRAFISALEVKGFTVIPAGKILKVVPLRDMKTLPITTDDEKAVGGDDIFVTRLIPIRYTNAAEIAKSLRGLISRNGDIISYDPTNTLIVTDNIGNLRRLMKIIDRLDQQGFEESIEIIKLKYAPAADMTDKISRIFNLKNQATGPAQPKLPDEAGASQFISKVIPDERTNALIVVANKEGIRRVREVVDQIDQTLGDEIGKGKIHVLPLQYADATELAGTLSGVASGMRQSRSGSSSRPSSSGSMFTQLNQTPPPPIPSSGGGGGGVNMLGDNVRITADQSTNSLIITASAADFESLLSVIRKLDTRRPQAFVEAMIMEIDIDKAFDVGIAGNIATQFGNGNSLFGATTFGTDSSIFLPTGVTDIQGLTVGSQGKTFDVPLAGGQKLTVPIYGGLFRALQTNGTINVLSTPNILTSDNTEAEIVVGQVIPFITAQGRDINNQPINQIQRENVAITLRVTPQINTSDELTMDIFQEIQDLVPTADSATLGPTTSKRSAKTTVLVKDSQTVTIGGLINDRIQSSVSKVPVLGDIPLLGWLFKSKNSSKRKTSLVIFITPHIVRLPEDLQDISIRKNNQRKHFMEENNIQEHPGLGKYDLDSELRVPPAKAAAPVPADGPTGGFMVSPETSATKQAD